MFQGKCLLLCRVIMMTEYRVYHDNGDGEREYEEGHDEHEGVEEHLPRPQFKNNFFAEM